MDGARSREDWVCASQLGSLGRWGNQLLQLIACLALAESQGLELAVVASWDRRFGCLLCGSGGSGEDEDDDEDPTATAPANGNGPLPAAPSTRWHPLPDHQAWALPVVSDRVVLSHAGFRAWIATREPYLALAAAAGADALSGRQLRRLFPQATVADLRQGPCSNGSIDNVTDPTAPLPPRLAGRGLWGWFQWPSAALAPFAPRLLLSGPLAPLRLRPGLARALDAAVDALVYTRGTRRRKRTRRFVAVHVRRGDFSAGPAAASASSAAAAAAAGGASPAPLRTEPPFEVGGGESWDDQGMCWGTPLEWLRPALEEAVGGLAAEGGRGGSGKEEEQEEKEDLPPLVVLCTDDPDLARDPHAVWPGAVTWARPGMVAGHTQEDQEKEEGGLAAALEGARAALAACRPDGDDGKEAAADLGMLLDWRLMQRADTLLASNSTFSFTAALLRDDHAPPPPLSSSSSPAPAPSAPDAAPLPTRPRPVFLRPCPDAGGFVAFDPWNSLPLLPSRPNLPANHGARQLRRP